MCERQVAHAPEHDVTVSALQRGQRNPSTRNPQTAHTVSITEGRGLSFT